MPSKPKSKAEKTEEPVVSVKFVGQSAGLAMPQYESEGAAGIDLLAAIGDVIRIAPGDRFLVPTGVVMEIPAGYEGQVRPRSGLALKHGITVLNAPGTVDSDYRGEIGVILVNQGDEVFEVRRGMRIAQLVVAKVEKAKLVQTETVTETTRGEGGFGSTGENAEQEGSSETE